MKPMVAESLNKLKMPSFEEPHDWESATKAVNELTALAYKAITTAEEIADKHKLTFSFNLAYGMGGSFVPKSVFLDEKDEEYDSEPEEGDDYGWMPSSRGC